MRKITFLFLLYISSNFAIAQEVQVEIERLGRYSSTNWNISDAYGQIIVSSKDFDEQDFIMSLEANTKFYFNVNIESISDKDTSLYFLKLNNDPIILLNNNLEIGDHAYLFYTGKKSPELRIIGGSDVSIEDYPWQVYLTAGDYMCGGTIISENWILTAAHCVLDDDGNVINVNNMEIKVGATNPYRILQGKEYAIKNVIVHKNYNINDIEYDIAVLELYNSIDFENAEPIELISEEEARDGATAPGVLATVSGWGLTRVIPDKDYATTLQAAELPIVSNETAATVWGSIDSSILMAGYRFGGKDACSGDSGGPLTVDVDGEPKLAGIVSWGSSNCNTYGGYTRVSSYLDWIYDNTGIPRPAKLSAPLGTDAICNKAGQYNYVTDETDASYYEWDLLPATAGILSFDGRESTITWDDDYYGTAQIKVRALIEDELTSWAITNVEILELTNVAYQEGDTTICNNANATFYVSASGDDLSYLWYKDGEYFETTSNGNLFFENADTTKTGTYYCSVEGTCGTQESGNIQLTVYPTTEIYSSPDDQLLLQNSDFSLNILSHGHDLSYQWFKDGGAITDGGDMNYLDLLSVNAADIGQYWLQVDGTCGSDVSDSIYIYVDLAENTEITAKVWPSFTSNILNMAISNTNLYSVNIYNISGEVIYANEASSLQTAINVSTWPGGLYIVKITSEGLESTFKIIKF